MRPHEWLNAFLRWLISPRKPESLLTREERELKALEFIRRNRKTGREKWGPGFAIVFAAGGLSLAASCPNLPQIDKDCRVTPCDPGEVCTRPVDGSFTWTCKPADPEPTPPPPTTLPPPTTTLPSPTPTPPPPSPTPTPVPTPSPCIPGAQKVCVRGDGSTFPFDRLACWVCADWQGYMIRNGYFTAGDPKEDGDVGGHPGFWLNYDPQGVLVGFISKRDCKNKQGVLVVDYPRAEERVIPCPTPTPTPSPGPTPTPGPTPSPLPGGVKCAPLSHIGVSFLAQHPAPNGPLGYRWVFSATNKAVKPYCPENRNECEQMGYEGDPVNDYARVVWRFDERFRCQAPYEPLWNQQEPHTGDHWENTDVRQENHWNANLKPAVRGLHRIRVCDPRSPGPSHGDSGGNCRVAERVAN